MGELNYTSRRMLLRMREGGGMVGKNIQNRKAGERTWQADHQPSIDRTEMSVRRWRRRRGPERDKRLKSST